MKLCFSQHFRLCITALVLLALIYFHSLTLASSLDETDAVGSLKILSPPEPLPDVGWKIVWSSQPGLTYVLQKWNGVSLNDNERPEWEEVTRLTALSTVEEAEDRSGSRNDEQRYYRIVQIHSDGESGEIIRILGYPEPTQTGLKITWESSPGKSYTLQRWTSDDLGTRAQPLWTDLVTVVADGETASAQDTPAGDVDQRFYRVILSEGEGPELMDEAPPSVSSITAIEVELDGQRALQMRVSAEDESAVAEVVFLDLETQLGHGISLGDDRWELTVPFDLDVRPNPVLIAKVTDAFGNIAFSTVLKYGQESEDRFVAIGEDNEPVEDREVEPTPEGVLPPFEYRRGGRGRGAESADWLIRFPGGAKVVTMDGKEYFEFSAASARFGEHYPLQFDLGSSAFDGALTPTGSATGLLPVGPIQATELAEAFGLDIEQGIPVLLFGRFPLSWVGGMLEDFSIRAPRFKMRGLNLPLPDISGAYSGYVLELAQEGEVRLPFYGEFQIPDGSGMPPRFRVPATRPLWLTLCADGRIGLEGRVEALFQNGAHFGLDLKLDDPHYRLHLKAADLQVRSLQEWVDQLPSSPADLIPSQPDMQRVDEVLDSLQDFSETISAFSVDLLDALPLPSDPNENILELPPGMLLGSSSSLHSWVSGLGLNSEGLSIAGLSEVIEQVGLSAHAESDLASLLTKWADLQTLVNGFVDGSIQGDETNMAALQSAIDNVSLSVENRLLQFDSVSSPDSMKEAASALSRLQTSLALSGGSFDLELSEGLSLLVRRFVNSMTAGLDIEPGVFDPQANLVIQAMGRLETGEQLKLWVQMLTELENAGFPVESFPGVSETIAQLGVRHLGLANQALAQAASGNDLEAYTLAFRDLLLWRDLSEMPGFPNATPVQNLLSQADVNAFAQEWQSLLLTEFASGMEDDTFRNLKLRIENHLQILNGLSMDTALATEPFQEMINRMEQELQAAMVQVEGTTQLADLLFWLKAGAAQSELAHRIGLDNAGNWEANRLPRIVERLAEVGLSQLSWSELRQAVESLLNQARRFKDQGREDITWIYMEQSAVLLNTARAVATGLWEESGIGESVESVLEATLMQLPGGLRVEQVAGAANYNRLTREFEGVFQGDLFLPEYGTALSVNRASFNGSGEFDLSGYGQLQFPLENPIGRANVPARSPLHVSYRHSEGLRISGGAEFEFENGMFFKGSVLLDDPIYDFRLEAGGLQFDLLDSLLPVLPEFPSSADLSPDSLFAWNRLLGNIRSSFLSMLPGVESEGFMVPGLPPRFRDDAGTDPYAALEAWNDLILLGAESGDLSGYASTYPHIERLVANFGKSFSDKLDELGEPDPQAVGLNALSNSNAGNVVMGPALQINLGGDTFSGLYFGEGPAHQEGLLPRAETLGASRDSYWNNISVRTQTSAGSDVFSDLIFSDHSSTEGIQVDFGLSTGPNSIEIDWNREPRVNAAIGSVDVPEGVLDAELMRTGVFGLGSDPTAAGEKVGLRIRGIDPGFYYVYGLLYPGPEDSATYTVWIGKGIGRLDSLEPMDVFPNSSSSAHAAWQAHENFVQGKVHITQAGEDVVLVSSRNPANLDSNSSRRGILNGIQIVAPLPIINDPGGFTTSDKSIDYGETITLSWDVKHAQEVIVEPGLGSFPVNQFELSVSPTRTTTYTLTARNANGSVSREVTVGVRQNPDSVRELIDEANRKITSGLAEAARAQLNGSEAPLDLSEALNCSDKIEDEVIKLLNDPRNVEDRDKARKTLKTALETAGAKAVLGGESEITQEKLIEFKDRADEEYEKQQGYDPESGTVNVGEVNAKSGDESLEVVENLLDNFGDGAALGSDRNINPNLIAAHSNNALQKLLEEIGYENGTAQLGGFNIGQIRKFGEDFLSIEDVSNLVNETSIVPANVFVLLGEELQVKSERQLSQTTRNQWQQRYVLVREIDFGNTLLNKGGVGLKRTGIMHEETLTAARQMEAEVGESGRFRSLEEVELMKFMQGYLQDESIATIYRSRMVKALTAIELSIDPEWTDLEPGIYRQRLLDAVPLLQELLQLHDFYMVYRVLPTQTPIETALLPETLIPQLRDRLLALTSILEDQEEGFSIYTSVQIEEEFIQLLLEESNKRGLVQGQFRFIEPEFGGIRLSASSIRSDTNSLNGTKATGNSLQATSPPDSMAEILLQEAKVALGVLSEKTAQLQDRSEMLLPQDLTLPGNLRVARVYGHLFYNRDTRLIRGGFGGRLEFPDLDAFFEIDEASLSNDGQFRFAASTAGSLSFGQVRAEADIEAEGRIPGTLELSGNGLLIIPGDQGEQEFAASVSYNSDTFRLRFDTDTNNTVLRFTDDFVLFDAGLGLELSTESPAGELVIVGTVGLFAINPPLDDDPSIEDFYLYVEDASLASNLSETGFDVVLDSGTLHLPDYFLTGFCEDLPDSEGGPVIDLTPDRAIQISYRTNPEEVTFAGALEFRNIGLRIQELNDLEVGICSADLVFEEGSLPLLTNLEASLEVALLNQTLSLRLSDAEWGLDGYPTGVISLENDFVLVERNGFSLTFQTEVVEDCPGAEMILSKDDLGLPNLDLSGGMELILPTDVLTFVDGSPVSVRGCGALNVNSQSLPQLVVDRLEVQGDFELANSDGIQLKGASLLVEHPEALLDPNASAEPFRISVTGGRLELPNGTYFVVNQGEISLDGSFLIDAEAGSGDLLEFTGTRIEAAILASRDTSGLVSIAGSGELEWVESGQIFSVTVGYEQASQTLFFDSQAENLNLRLADDFVLFDAGFGFSVSGTLLEGRMEIRGSAGMVSKTTELPEEITRDAFELVVDETVAAIQFDAEGFEVGLEQGRLCLPDLFETSLCSENEDTQGGGPEIILSPNRSLFVRYTSVDNRVSFGGEIEFRDIGFVIPGIDDLSVALCSATLQFSDETLPVLSNLNGTLQLPLPNEPAVIDLLDATWRLDGFPVGTIALRNELTLLNAGGFSFSIVGQEDEFCPVGSALTIYDDDGLPGFRLDGGIRFVVPADILSDDTGGQLFTTVCSGVDFGFQQPPVFELTALSIGAAGASFRLGGENGLLIENASLMAQGIENLFFQSEDSPFVLVLSGAFEIPNGPGFELKEAQFEFVGEPLPRFSISGAEVSTGETFEAAAGLPIQVSEAGFTFVDRDLPLPALLAPENLIVNVSASMGLPPEEPILSGQIQGLTVTLVNGVPQVNISGIGFGIEEFEVPPLSLTGQVFIGGLGPGEDIYFAGIVGGSFQGAGVQALLALNLQGPLGCCFSVNAGPAGIPLGQTGILFTGAEGGVSFLNTNGDPCDFQTFINVDEETGRPVDSMNVGGDSGLNGFGSIRTASLNAPPKPIGEMHVMTWKELREMQERTRLYQEAEQAGINLQPQSRPLQKISKLNVGNDIGMIINPVATQPISVMAEEAPEFPCPTGDCPPQTVNILCQPHPDFELYPDRIIIKFSSLDESFLNDIGITRDWIESLGLTTAEGIATEIASRLREAIDAVTPRPDPAFTGPNGEPIGAQLNALLDEVMTHIELSFKATIQSGVQGLLGDSSNVYNAILEAAYAGAGCPDATIKLTGTFSHLSVSSFLSGTGGGVLSSTGSAGLVGTVNLFGVPVGFLDGFVNGTDANGDPNPSLCGVIRAAVGPLELGQLKALYECEGCVTGVLESFADLAGCLSQEVVDAILPKVAPHLVGLSPLNAMNAMNNPEKLAFLGEMFSLPPTDGTPECFLNLVVDSLGAINPEFTMCGAAQPRLFGFPLNAGGIEVAAAADKTSMAGQFAYSPSQMFLPYGSLLPIGDQGSFGFGIAWPNPDDLIIGGLTGRFSDPAALAAYLEESFAYMLANATYTIGYELSPLGLTGFQSGARVVMPNLTHHPEISGWVPPGERNQGLPSRLELMLASVENGVLSNPLWKGVSDDIHLAFAENDPRRQQVIGLSFSEDYFPHGGIVGAARLGIPRAIIDAPPESLTTLLDPSADLFARLTAALDYVQNYILNASEVGTLGFYVPAPNPPIFVDAEGQPLEPEALLGAIMTFNSETVMTSGLYPLEQAFLQGYMDGRLLGIPIARARVEATPPSENEEGRLLIASEIPQDSWMQSFVDNAEMVFEIKQTPPRSIEDRFAEIQVQIQELLNTDATPEAVGNFMQQFEENLFADLPKVALELSINNLRIPQALAGVLSVDGNSSAQFLAFSPRYEPEAEGTGPIVLARRNGGVALQASLRFADLITIDNAELAVFPGQLSALSGLPAMAGQFDVPLMPLGANLNLRNVLLDFNSEPQVGEAYLAGSGQLNPIQVQPLMEIRPLNINETLLGGELRVLRTASSFPSTFISIEPSRIEAPVFAEGIEVRIHGADEDQPFTFSADSPWEASVSLTGGLLLRDLSGLPVVRIGSATQQFSAAFSGNGLQSGSLRLDLPIGVEVTAFPGSNSETSFFLGPDDGGDAQLTVSSDGTFELLGGLQGNLELEGLSVEQMNAGAEIRLTQDSLRLTGSVSGGSLDGVNTGSASSTIVISPQGISFIGMVSIPPLQFGVFRVSGQDGGNLEGVLDNTRLNIPSGAKLAIQGVVENLLTLQSFVVEADGDFSVQIASGNLAVPNYFTLSEGTGLFSQSSGVARFEMLAPRMTVFPESDFETIFPTPLERLIIESTGRFYYDSGQQSLALPSTFSAQGRLELGYEPNPNAPVLEYDPSPVNFGLVDTGQSAVHTVRATNSGGAQLLMSASTSDNQVFEVTPSFASLAPGEAMDFEILFTPQEGGTANGILEWTHTAVSSPTQLSLTGEGRDRPVYFQSTGNLAFGDVPAGSGSLRQFFIVNIGQAPLEIDSISTDTPFSVSPQSGTLAPGDSLRVFVTFRPELLGPVSSTLDIVSNDDTGSHQLNLSGNGTELRWWIQRNGGPTLRSIDNFYAVGDEGTLLQMGFGGDRWTPHPALGQLQLNRIFRNPIGFGNTYAVGRSGVVLQLQGQEWKPIADPVVAFGGNIYRGVATYWPSQFLMMVGDRGLMVREHSFGQYSQPNSGTLDDLYDVGFNQNGGFGIVVGEDGTLLRSTNQGATWNTVSLPSGVSGINRTLRAVDINSNNVALVVGDFGTILRSSNNGLSWQNISNVPTDRNLNDVCLVGQKGYIVGDDGVFLTSEDGGLNWQIEVTAATTQDLHGVMVRNEEVWVVGQGGLIQHRPIEPPVGPRLTRSTGLLDFGTIAVGDTAKKTVALYNRGTEILEISSITVGGVFSVGQTSMQIEPGGQRLLEVYFHPQAPMNVPIGQPNQVITFETNDVSGDPDGMEYLVLRGVAREIAWSQVAGGTSEHLIEIQFIGPNLGYAIYAGGILKTVDGGGSWSELSVTNLPGTIRTLHFLNSQTGLIGGGDNGVPFILRTTNGGTTWIPASLNSSIEGVVADISVAPGEDSRGYAVTEGFTIGQLNKQGMVIRTGNAGSNWFPTTASRPATTFSGSVIESYNPFRIYVSSGGALYRSRNSGFSWEEIFNSGGAFPIESMDTVGLSNGFVGGVNGLARRTDSVDGTETDWSAPVIFASGTINDVHFVTQQVGWCAVGGAGSGGVSRIYRTEDGGVTWEEEFTIFDGEINSIWGVSSSLAYAAGTHGRVWKYQSQAVETNGVLGSPSFVSLGEIRQGERTSTTIELRNLGNALLSLDRIFIETPNETQPFDLGALTKNQLAPDETVEIPLSFESDRPGQFTALITVTGDGKEQAKTIEVRASVVAQAQWILFETDPPGLSVIIDGETFQAPVAFSVDDNDGVIGNWEPDSVHTISAPDFQFIDEVAYRFQTWTTSAQRDFEVVATTQDPQRYLARFVRSSTISSVNTAASITNEKARIKLAIESIPTDVPTGPWLRLSDAGFTIPGLGNLDVKGAAFISARHLSVLLESGPVRIPSNTGLAEVLSISTGAWLLDYRDTGESRSMVLKAFSPFVELFDVPTVPPSQLEIDFSDDGLFGLSFQTQGSTPILPSVFEMGPASIQLVRDPFLSLTVDGELRLLKTPDGAWAIREPLAFEAREGPFEFELDDLPATLMDLGFLALRTDSNSAIRIARDASGVFSLDLNRIEIDLLGRSFADVSGSMQSDGQLSLNLEPPVNPFVIGPFRLQSENESEIRWNLLTGEIAVELAGGKLKASGIPGWPSNGFDFPSIVLDGEGDFEKKIDLPSFNFDGVNLSAGGSRNKNYILFKRVSGVVSLQVRDERTFFGNEFNLAFDMDTNGSISGSFTGSFSIDTQLFGKLNFGSVSLGYDPDESTYPFQGRFPLIGNQFGIYFGSGGKFSHLNCDGPGIDNCDEGLFSITAP